ncbi:glutamate 5-kinase [bacterium]|nr:glutamate 5-kinase [bacterium]
MKRTDFKNAKRIVIKFGTNVLTNEEGQISLSRVYSFVEDVYRLKKTGKEIILVTSGAVGLGRGKVSKYCPNKEALKQACAAIGQSKLMSIYEDAFEQYNLLVAQILLIEEDFSQRKQYLSIQETLLNLLELNVIPIINQNDTVSSLNQQDDIQMCFTDNDKLSALVASSLNADMLVILSDIDALYNDNPKENKDAKPIYVVEELTDEIMNYASGVSNAGRGGMKTKLEAAKLVTRSGCTAVVASGMEQSVLKRIFDGENLGTIFLPSKTLLTGKKRWIGYATNILGKIVVDDGARNAVLNKETSLLPIGLIEVINEFNKGDVVSVLDKDCNEFARGIVNYNSQECRKIMGQHSDMTENLIGHKNYDAIITRDNITIL